MCGSFADLPANARKYLDRISELLRPPGGSGLGWPRPPADDFCSADVSDARTGHFHRPVRRSRSAERLPRHIAIIMDGNGRWARQRGLPRIEGHRRGATSVRRVTEECARLGIEQITLYCLSSENWKRPAEELDFLLQLLAAVSGRRAAADHGAQHPGTLDRPPRRSAARSRAGTRRNGPPERRQHRPARVPGDQLRRPGRNGRRRAAHCRRGHARASSIRRPSTKRRFPHRLYTAGMPEPDLLIRTAGEMRISNFLLVADQLRRDLGDRRLLARFRRGPTSRGAAKLRRPGPAVRRPDGIAMAAAIDRARQIGVSSPSN